MRHPAPLTQDPRIGHPASSCCAVHRQGGALSRTRIRHVSRSGDEFIAASGYVAPVE
jgi:hypothetical protein